MKKINDYSQHREGEVIARYFGESKGTLISLGENDGKTLSNVLGLIEIGWKGYLVEPSQIPFKKLIELHKSNDKVKCFNYAIGNEDGETTFYESGEHLGKGDTSLLSTIKEDELKRWGKTCTFKKITVPVKTWDSFIKDSKVKKAHLISIDCEGVDFDILIQIDFDKLDTKMIIVESNNVDNKKYSDYMNSKGYRLYYANQCNLIFTK